jgi:restriction system protein
MIEYGQEVAMNGISKIIAVFEQLLIDLEQEAGRVKQEGSRSFQENDYTNAQIHLDNAKKLSQFQSQISQMYEELKKMQKIRPVQVDSGQCISQQEYMIPVLKALYKRGGSGRTKEILESVHEMLKNKFSNKDMEKIPSGYDLRWHKIIYWAIFTMKGMGLLKNDSQPGIWEISDKGRQYLKKKGILKN